MDHILMVSQPSVDIILVTFKRKDLLNNVLKSLVRSIDYCPLFNYQLKVFINGPDPDSLALLEEYKSKFSFGLTIMTSESRLSPAAARNSAVTEARLNSDWIFFIDDDIVIPESIFSSLNLLTTQYPSIQVWGGPNITPLHSTSTQQDIGWVLNSWWVVGPTSRRYRWSKQRYSKGTHYNLMLCNLIISTRCFSSDPFFSFFRTAEENELLLRLEKLNAQFGFSDELFVYHERRNDWLLFLKQIFYYGFGRGQLIVFQKLMPQWIFLFFMVATSFGFIVISIFPKVSLLILTAYFLFSYIQFVLSRGRFSVTAAAISPLIPLLYYFGILRGITLELTKRYNRRGPLSLVKSPTFLKNNCN